MSKDVLVKILSEAAEMLKSDGWSQFAMARDADGKPCALNSERAVAFCLFGALVKTWRRIDVENEDLYFEFFQSRLAEILEKKYHYHYTVTRWNDNVAKNVSDVIEFIGECIAQIGVSVRSSSLDAVAVK